MPQKRAYYYYVVRLPATGQRDQHGFGATSGAPSVLSQLRAFSRRHPSFTFTMVMMAEVCLISVGTPRLEGREEGWAAELARLLVVGTLGGRESEVVEPLLSGVEQW